MVLRETQWAGLFDVGVEEGMDGERGCVCEVCVVCVCVCVWCVCVCVHVCMCVCVCVFLAEYVCFIPNTFPTLHLGILWHGL